MKKLLLATCLTAIFASGALGQSGYYTGNFIFSIPRDSLITEGVTFEMDSAWQWEYTDIDAFDGYKVVTLNPDGPLQEQGEWEIAVTAKQAYSSIANCMDGDDWWFWYKLLGGNDSAGLVLEMSWDSTKWYNLSDSAELSHFFDAATAELDFWNDIYPTPTDSTIITLPDGRKALGPVGDWYEFTFGVLPPYTWAGVGSLNELHWRATFVNYSHQPVLFGTHEYMNYVLYWCEHLGIGEQEGNLNVKVYPNPVTSCSVMELPHDVAYPAQVVISDPGGRVVYYNTNIRQAAISMANMNLKQGIYMYSIKDSENKTSVGKFIVK